MHASSPLPVDDADLTRCGRRNRDDIEVKPIQEIGHLRADLSSGRDDQHFGQYAGRNQDFIFGLKRGFLNQPGELSLGFNPKWPNEPLISAGPLNWLLGMIALCGALTRWGAR